MKRYYVTSLVVATAAIAIPLVYLIQASSVTAATTAHDPGVRTTPTSGIKPGDPLPGLTSGQRKLFEAGKEEFLEVETADEGLGPRLNLDSCNGCHSQPATGGSSPRGDPHPQIVFANNNGQTIPSFIKLNGPVREARFVRNPDGSPDGGVHSLFTIPGCGLAQPNFQAAVDNHNVIFRIPTPVFGAGLIEQIPDTVIRNNQAANTTSKRALGIRGRPNIVLAGSAISGQPNFNGNDGTAARFGWKAQNKSLLLFAGEAYNVEMGITNELFQTEREEAPGCQTTTGAPDSTTNGDTDNKIEALSAIEKFAAFMRFLAPPAPANSPGTPSSLATGKMLFTTVGCAHCHTPTLTTRTSSVAALSQKPVNLYSDLLVHDMGRGLADGVSQGQAGPRDFRTAPLWGLGQRIFFLHDGRTSDLLEAIQQHRSGSATNGDASEANAVISKFNSLSEDNKQNLLNFLRSL